MMRREAKGIVGGRGTVAQERNSAGNAGERGPVPTPLMSQRTADILAIVISLLCVLLLPMLGYAIGWELWPR